MTVQGIIQKKVLFKEHATEYVTVFCLLTFLFILPFSKGVLFPLSASTFFLFYIFSLLAVLALLLVIKAYRHMELSTVEPLRNLSPFIILILAYFILGETITWINSIGMALLIVGGYTLEAAVQHGNLFRPFALFKGKYMHFLILSMLIGGVATIFLRILLLRTDALTALFFLFFFSSVNMLIIQFAKYKGMQDIFYVLRTNGFLVVLIALASLLSDLAYFTALAMPTTYTALAISIRRLSTLFTTIIGGEIFHETRLLVKSIACTIMLVGVYFIIL